MISVIIPAYNAAETLEDCLRAVGHLDYQDFEVIVVDDASTDNTAAIASSFPCRVVRSPSNRGAAQARNEGARLAQGEVIVFTDADVLLPADALRLLEENFRDPSIAGVVGLLGSKLRYTNFASQFKNLWMYHTYARLGDRPVAGRGVGLFFTSIAAIRQVVFWKHGGFDAHYKGASITEDVEFGQRLLTAGDRVLLERRLAVEHLKHYEFAELLKTDLKRSFGLAKTWLRKAAQAKRGSVSHKYYTSVPWSFILSVPLAWLLPVLALLSIARGLGPWLAALVSVYGMILVLNWAFLSTLYEARGLFFLVQSCLFLPLDLWVSGLGVLWAVLDFLAGRGY